MAHRDGTRRCCSAGLSLLFGMLLGDFVGGGAVVIAAKAILQTSYTRDVETAADAYAVALMKKIDGDPRALGTILTVLPGAPIPASSSCLIIPRPGTALPASRRAQEPGRRRPLLDPAEWAASRASVPGS